MDWNPATWPHPLNSVLASARWWSQEQRAASPSQLAIFLSAESIAVIFIVTTSTLDPVLAKVCLFLSKQNAFYDYNCWLVAQSRPTLCNPMDCSLPGSSVQRVFQARILEWVVIPPLEDLSDPGIKPMSPALTGGFFHHWATCKAPINCMPKTK